MYMWLIWVLKKEFEHGLDVFNFFNGERSSVFVIAMIALLKMGCLINTPFSELGVLTKHPYICVFAVAPLGCLEDKTPLEELCCQAV